MYKKILLIVLLVCSPWLSACQRLAIQSSGHSEKKPIQIGAIFPLSGPLSYLGELDQKGAQLAVKKINDSGGVHGRLLELVLEDSQGNATQGVQAVNKLINLSNLTFLINSISAVSSSIAPIVQEGDKILLYRSTEDEIAQTHDHVFKNYVSVTQDAQALATAAIHENKQRLSVLYFQVPTGEIFNQSFIKQAGQLGAEIVLSQSLKTDSVDLKSQLIKIKESGAEAIAFAGYEAQTIIFLTQLDELNIPSDIFLFLITPKVLESVSARKSLEHRKSIASGWIDYDDNERSKKFLAAYQKEFGSPPTLVDAAYTYDNIFLMAEAMKQCPDPEDVACLIDQLASIEYDGVIGKIKFDQNRVAATPTNLFEFIEGNWIKYEY